MLNNRFYTYGEFTTEEEAHSYFESIVPKDLFKVHKEISGYYNDARQHILRIDFILIPLRKLTDAGWNLGVIGVECKKSGYDIGRPISQMLDYNYTTWVLESSKIQVRLNFVFLFPMQPITGQLASVMCQNRIGVCCQNIDKWKPETFVLQSADGRRILTVFENGDFKFQPSTQGQKVGSR